eukprot:TRINITY_DN4930_c0_g2_i3.p1 TRINITY_DN4930_c0_g2~~TRINITY_DN4930_c0_g2_i3.p1  ORF type:complete len:312 (+),score=49.81 TRINITY_DN4930_c0_g2_i3:75-1010(+)
MSAGRCGCAAAEPHQWLKVEDVFGTVASFLPIFELAAFAASSSQAAAAVQCVVEEHWEAVAGLDDGTMDLMQELEGFSKALETAADTAEGLVHGGDSLVVLHFSTMVHSYAAAVARITSSFGREYALPWECHRRKLAGWLRCMHMVQRQHAERRLRCLRADCRRIRAQMRAEASSGAAPDAGRRGRSPPRRPRPGSASSSRRRGATPEPRGPAAGGAPSRPSVASAGAGGRGRSRASAGALGTSAAAPAAAAGASAGTQRGGRQRRAAGPAAAGGRGAPAAAPAASTAAAAGAAAGEQRRQVQAVKPAAAW